MNADDGRLAALAALNEPLRRRIYDYVAGQDASISRDQATASLGVPRSVAAFHLDKLAEVGLLQVDYRRPSGRGGPGAGRPAKWYRRAAGEIMLSVPARRYDLAAALLAQAVQDATDRSVPVLDALQSVAAEYGRSIGAHLDTSTRRSRRRVVEQVAELLAEYGYEPRLEAGTIRLANCPFHALAEQHRELVCGMNHALITGAVEAAGLPAGTTRLEPTPGGCCVHLVA